MDPSTSATRWRPRQQDFEELWVKRVENVSWTTTETARTAADLLRRAGAATGTVGVERSFLPDDAREVLERALPEARFVEALPVLEELRAVKRPDEARAPPARRRPIIESMLAVVESAEPGEPTAEIAQRLRLEETTRGLSFEYCAVSAGRSPNRAPSRTVERGDVLSLDSGGSLHVYRRPREDGLHGRADIAHAGAARRDRHRPARCPGRDSSRLHRTRHVRSGRCLPGRLPSRQRDHVRRPRDGTRVTRGAAAERDRRSAYPATHRDRRLEPGCSPWRLSSTTIVSAS